MDDLESVNKSFISNTGHSPDHSMTNMSSATGNERKRKGPARSVASWKSSFRPTKKGGDDRASLDTNGGQRKEKRTRNRKEKKDRKLNNYFKAYFNQ